ncbi:LolA family protein [Tundrisphaera sp. TA3]|uniref:LolA family protein n=1 Tax=Tundrisphaera sp. TA3 TaxID=3435775 RepID=UPI003EBBDC15
MIGSRFARPWMIVIGLACGATLAPADEPARPRIDQARLGPILDEWARRSAALTSVDVRYTGEERSAAWGSTPISGRAVLLRDGRARLDVAEHDDQGREAQRSRLVWTGTDLHQFRFDTKQRFVYPKAERDRGRLPDLLTLPFAWGWDRDGLTSRYRVELVNELAEVWCLKVTPPEPAKATFSRAFILLDRATYLPRLYYLFDRDGKSQTQYKVAEIHADRPIPDDLLSVADEPGWETVRTEPIDYARWLAGMSRAFVLYRTVFFR